MCTYFQYDANVDSYKTIRMANIFLLLNLLRFQYSVDVMYSCCIYAILLIK